MLNISLFKYFENISTVLHIVKMQLKVGTDAHLSPFAAFLLFSNFEARLEKRDIFEYTVPVTWGLLFCYSNILFLWYN